MSTEAEVKNVLIIHTWGLGDMILLTPVLNVVSRLHPGAKFTFLVFQKTSSAPIISAPYTKEVLYCGRTMPDLLRLVAKLSKTRFDAALFTSGVNPIKAGLLLLCIRAKVKVGEIQKHRFPFLIAYARYEESESRTGNNYRLFSQIFHLPEWDAANQDRQTYKLYTSYYLKQQDFDYAQSYFEDRRLENRMVVCIHPGCLAKNSYRRWSKESFSELVTLLKSNYDCAAVIVAGPDELEEAKFISKNTDSILLANETLNHVAAVISRCDLFINTDSGLGHIASCFDRKTLTIFGPGDERQTAPFSVNSHIIRIPMACAPCLKLKKRNCSSECLRDLNPNLVFDAARQIVIQNLPKP
jgi:heptosyltransferase II